MSTARAYLITFTCYGSHLHGAEPATVHRNHNCFGGRWLEPHPGRLLAAEKRMKQLHYLLDPPSRQVVVESIQEICALRHWDLLAVHVRTNHVHVVVEASVKPEIVMHAFKAHASQILNRQQPGIKRWTRHGSTRSMGRSTGK